MTRELEDSVETREGEHILPEILPICHDAMMGTFFAETSSGREGAYTTLAVRVYDLERPYLPMPRPA